MITKTSQLPVLRNENGTFEEIKQELSLLNTQAQHYLHAAISYNTHKAYQADVRHLSLGAGCYRPRLMC